MNVSRTLVGYCSWVNLPAFYLSENHGGVWKSLGISLGMKAWLCSCGFGFWRWIERFARLFQDEVLSSRYVVVSISIDVLGHPTILPRSQQPYKDRD